MRWIASLILGILLVSCNTTAPNTTTLTPQVEPAATVSAVASAVAPDPAASASAVAPDPYPIATEAYPGPGTPSYPAPTLKQGPAFTINEPVKATDTQVSGTGQAGVPLRLIDITNNADQLATVVIAADGTFSFDVTGKLISGNRIALMLNESGGQVNREDFISGPGYQDIPQIGVVFDNTSIE